MRLFCRRPSIIAGLLTAAASVPAFSHAANPVDQKTQIIAAENLVHKAAELYKSRKFSAAGVSIQSAEKSLERAEVRASDANLADRTEKLTKQIAKARALLAKQGIRLRESNADGAHAPVSGKSDAAAISFTRDVAPLLIAKCGACHVRAAKGGLSMATFATLSKGSKNGKVIVPANAQTSQIVAVIESGDMPRNGGTVAPAELAVLSRWINQGAKFDGPDPVAPLTDAVPASQPTLARPTGREKVQFSRDIGPVLLAHCVTCHGERNPRAQLSFTTFARLLRGGASGEILSPADAENSLVLKKIRGTLGDRMPLGKPPLADEVIAKFETWIAEGATFDGGEANRPLAEVVAITRARQSTHEELSRYRSALAASNWHLALPDSRALKRDTTNFLVIGNLSAPALDEVAQLAEAEAARLSKVLKLSADQPLIKGRMTIFVFDKRYDYGEVGQMVEKREIPAESRGHWRYTVADAYGCVLPPKNKEYELAPLLAQQITGIYVASLGDAPRWFAEGSARALAAKIGRKDARVKQWDERIAAIMASSPKPDAFMTNGLPPEENDIVSYGFVKSLLGGGGVRYANVLAGLRAGESFDESFARAFGSDPKAYAADWTAKATSRRR